MGGEGALRLCKNIATFAVIVSTIGSLTALACWIPAESSLSIRVLVFGGLAASIVAATAFLYWRDTSSSPVPEKVPVVLDDATIEMIARNRVASERQVEVRSVFTEEERTDRSDHLVHVSLCSDSHCPHEWCRPLKAEVEHTVECEEANTKHNPEAKTNWRHGYIDEDEEAGTTTIVTMVEFRNLWNEACNESHYERPLYWNCDRCSAVLQDVLLHEMECRDGACQVPFCSLPCRM